jgi:hypothetical protein
MGLAGRAAGPRPFFARRQAHPLPQELQSLRRRLIRMRLVRHNEVEQLLKRDFRSRLTLGQQILLYLDPFALFKDASEGRERALSYNRAMRWVLLPYLRRWLLITVSLFAAIAPAEAFAAEATIVPAATIAVGFCIAAAVLVLGVTRK